MPSTNGRGPQKKRVALYIRVSTDEQAKSGYSIPDQLRELTQHAEHAGYEVVVPPIVDDGYSGARSDRPGLVRVMELAEAGEIDVVLATKRDRFFRSRLYRLLMDGDLKELGVRLVALNDTNNKIGDGVMDDYAEWEREQITERTTAGRRARARAGKVLPGVIPPYGYCYTPDKTSYEVNEATMVNVRRIFREVSRGGSLHAMKRAFEEEGIVSPTGKAHWSAEFVRRVVWEQDAYKPHTFKNSKVCVWKAC